MKLLRGTLKVLAVLVLLFACVLGYAYWRSNQLLSEHIAVSEPALNIATDAQTIARGEHIATNLGCADCHGTDLGGKVVVDAFPIGRIAGPNLTPGKGGVGKSLNALAVERAIRHGLAMDGRPLLYMPAHNYNGLSDSDMADLIAYIETRAPVDHAVPAPVAGPLTRLLFVFGKMPLIEALQIDHHAAHKANMEIAANAQYGAYLAQTACSGCHGEHFSGGHVPGTPPDFPSAQNLTPDTSSGLGKWSKVDFITALRQGKRPDGTRINTFMPWPAFAHMTDIEVDALWIYLHSLPPRPLGQH